MERFIIEYDVDLESTDKEWILDNCVASMVSPNDDSIQYCVKDVRDMMMVKGYQIDYIEELYKDGIHYIEIVW